MSVTRRRTHVLPLIAALLVISGGVRVATGMEPAIAFAEEALAQQNGEMPTDDVADAPPIDALLAALQGREERVIERELAIDDRLYALAVAEEELAKRLVELQEAEASLAAALTVSETANDSDIGRLTTVFENMKAADAANLFGEMAPEFASGFLVRMQPEAAAAIMTGLEPQKAYSISVIIAGRNANAPTQ